MYNLFSRKSADATLADVSAHPLMKQVLADVAEEKRQAEIRAQEAQVEAHQHRMATIQSLKDQINEELKNYDQLRQKVRRSHGTMHILQQRLDTLVGSHHPVMPDGMLKLHLPLAFPGPNDDVFPLFPSGHVDVLHFQSTREWPSK